MGTELLLLIGMAMVVTVVVVVFLASRNEES
jgi:hypothetical protein